MGGLFDRPPQQPQQGLFGGIFAGMGRGLTNPGGFFVNEGAPAAQTLGSMVLSPFVQANQAMPWGGNDPSAIGIDTQTGSIDPNVMVPWATDVAGTVTAGAGMAPPVAGLGQGMRSQLYHGSPVSELKTLEPSIRGPLGPGVYTSPAKQVAEAYQYGEGGQLYKLPVKDRDIFMGHGHRTDDEWFGFREDQKRLIEAAEPENREKVASILEKMWSSDGYPTYQRIAKDVYGSDEGAQALFKKAGFEGVSGLVDGPEVLLFNRQGLGDKPYSVHVSTGGRF